MLIIPVVLTGLAQFTGVSGVVTYSTAAIYPLQNKMKFTHNFELEEVKDPSGFDAGWAARNENYVLDIGMQLVDDTPYENAAPGVAGTVANAVAGAFFAAPISIVTLSGFGGAHAAQIAWLNTSWQVLSGGDMDFSNTKINEMSWKLRRYTNASQQLLIATPPVV